MKVEKIKWFSVELCRNNPNKLYIYGDNTIGVGKGGQAAIRDEPNAHGIPTKVYPSMSSDSFFSDDDYESNIEIIRKTIDAIPQNYEAIVFPEDGLGTGLAELPLRAPRTYEWLVNEINQRFENIYA